MTPFRTRYMAWLGNRCQHGRLFIPWFTLRGVPWRGNLKDHWRKRPG
jgi:hypothetical protein